MVLMRYVPNPFSSRHRLTNVGASSTGFTASEYESDRVRREGAFVPTEFYHRFTLDVCKFADEFAQGRVVSVLEGGYSERALISGVAAHMAGMVEAGGQEIDHQWWSKDNLNIVSFLLLPICVVLMHLSSRSKNSHFPALGENRSWKLWPRGFSEPTRSRSASMTITTGMARPSSSYLRHHRHRRFLLFLSFQNARRPENPFRGVTSKTTMPCCRQNQAQALESLSHPNHQSSES